MMANPAFNKKSCDLLPLVVTQLSKCQYRGPSNGTLFNFIFSQITDKAPEINEIERKPRQEWLIVSGFVLNSLHLGESCRLASWLAGGWPRAQGFPGTAILPSYPTPPVPHSEAAPGQQEGSRSTASLEVGRRKLHLRSGFLPTACGAWGIEATVFLSHADKWNWGSQARAEQAGRLNPGMERKESRQIEITRCPCVAVI